MKKCSRCGETKPLSEFYKMSSSSDGHRPECKICHKTSKEKYALENPIETSAYTMASCLLKRLSNTDSAKNQCYIGIECRIGNSPKEIQAVLLEHFSKDIINLLSEGKIPSVDRIDSNGHYEIGNIQVIDLNENTNKGVQNAIKKTSRSIVALSKGGQKVEYPSVSAASRELGIKRDTIYSHLNTGTYSRAGYTFLSD